MANQETLAVVLGAGASHGCALPSLTLVRDEFCPPLTQDLFSVNYSALAKTVYPGMKGLFATIAGKVGKPDPAALESVLAKLSGDMSLRAQYRAVPLYLREVLQNVTYSYVVSGSIAYDRLVFDIKRCIGNGLFGSVLFISLNYDTLLEGALADQFGFSFTHFDDYIAGDRPLRLLKPHGCITWVRDAADGSLGDPRMSYASIPLDADLDSLPMEIVATPLNPIRGKSFLFPAIAIPAEGKTGFVCPPAHVAHAQELLKTCSHLLVVGCRLAEKHILGLLNGAPVSDISVVSKGEGEATSRKLFMGPFRNRRSLGRVPSVQVFEEGFADYVQGDHLEDFLGLPH